MQYSSFRFCRQDRLQPSFAVAGGSVRVSIVFALILCAASGLGFQARWVDEYQNPLDVSLADPAVLNVSGTYYIYSTGMACQFSSNLVDWRNSLFLYSRPQGDTRFNFWAPEVIRRPSDGKYIMFYTAQPVGGRLRVYVAQSSSPQGSFVDVYSTTPLFETNSGDAWLDQNPFIDTDGKAYLYVTKDVASASGRPDQGAIHVLPLDLDTLTVGMPTRVLSPDTTGWEVRPGGAAQIEGPFMVKHNSQYFLFYSGNLYSTANYAVGYAVGDSPTGPFTKYAGNPILQSGTGLPGPGHCSVSLSPDGREYLMFYHSKITSATGAERQLCIDRIDFIGPPGNETVRGAGVRSSGGGQASSAPQMLPGGVPPGSICPPFEPFDTLNPGTWHFMGENVFARDTNAGALGINAGSGDVLGTQTGISNLALAYAAQDDAWQVTTRLNAFAPTTNNQQAFVTIWKDQQNFVRLSDIYSGGRKFRVLKEEAGVTTFYDVANSLPNAKWLRIRKSGGHMFFYASPDGSNFSDLLNGTTNGYDVDWALDRQLQLGVGAVSPSSMAASFDAVWYDRLTPCSPGVDDEFNTTSVDRRLWLIQNEDRTMYAEEGNDLRIRTQDGDWANGRTDMRNLFLQSVPGGDWTVSTRVQTPDLDANYDQAFIVVADDHNNFIKYGRAYITGRRLEAGVESSGVWTATSIADPWPATAFVQLRIRKVGNTYYCEVSSDGVNWTQVATRNAAWTPLFAGLGAASPGSSHQHDCYFDWFHFSPSTVSGVNEWPLHD